MASLSLESISNLLWPPEGPAGASVYALLDAARDARIYQGIMEAPNQGVCLHRGGKAKDLAQVAPYLVPLAPGDDFFRWIVSNGWGRSWGIFAQSRGDLAEVIRHFQSLVVIHDEEGNALFFRYYDPRVLRIYLPTCRGGELRTFFGPVDLYMMEDADPAAASRMTHDAGALRSETIDLTKG